jgi:biopolymer transport protein ExbB
MPFRLRVLHLLVALKLALAPVASPHAQDAPPPDATVIAEEQPAAPLVNALLPSDLSPWGMFRSADVVVQAVMVGLVFASVVTWTVWLAKTFELLAARRRLRKAAAALGGARRLARASQRLRAKTGVARAFAKCRAYMGRLAAWPPAALQALP